MKKTPLYDRHVALGARMVDYAGWNMPVQYAGVKEEIAAVREETGIFDVSHMGEIRVSGRGAGGFLDWLLTRRVTGKKPDRITYAIMSAADGGTVDDLLVYTMGEEDYLLVVNAANKDKDLIHIRGSLDAYKMAYPDRPSGIAIIDESDLYGQLAVQGPGSLDLMLELAGQLGLSPEEKEELRDLKRFRALFVKMEGEDLDMIISRTGYTGENGYELYLPASKTGHYWDLFIETGVTPCGLGARDTLRLEAGMPLYGHEMSADINALEGGMSFFVDLDHDFQGRVMKDKVKRRQLALVSDTKAIPREGYEVYVEGSKVGVITSGTFSPTLDKGIAFALVDLDTPEVEKVEVLVRKNLQPFTVVEPPFVG
ncbi:MAG TPA: glycine cleavage system aminomethyltransferase GcvT [Bacillota bacterium]|jgi:aminomethyltransferase|nr:glycine cleavage system aminomethyltransferase GcvT [Fastidiosipila sp.]HPX92848.1 glycine cleavage system aminomethyltransferase GcvT [Bacillota bacterium]HQB81333.1 glycine cleavage system aminomethyltransferase GcvT [Bacillota bacterium]